MRFVGSKLDHWLGKEAFRNGNAVVRYGDVFAIAVLSGLWIVVFVTFLAVMNVRV